MSEDPFMQHEIIDRASILCSQWDMYIEDHPWVGRRPELASLANQIGELMGEFYQKAANVSYSSSEIVSPLTTGEKANGNTN
jgi:hypothetical protein